MFYLSLEEKMQSKRILCALSALLSIAVYAASPVVFTYQGVLLDSAGRGAVINDSVYFGLYTRTSGGGALWNETHFIQANNGVFSLNLGAKSTVNPSLVWNNDSLFLEVKKNNVVMGQRMHLTSVLYSIRAGFADSARVAGSQVWEKNGTNCLFPNGNVAVGTDSARERLEVSGNILVSVDTGSAALAIRSATNPALYFQQTGSTGPNRAKLAYSNNALSLNMWDSTGANESIGILTMRRHGTVLEAKGVIKAENFMVGTATLTVPDYVFDKEYQLLSLDSIARYINDHGHLPKVPSAQELNASGLDLAAMNMLLLEKIEELTLHAITQDRKILALEEKLNSLK